MKSIVSLIQKICLYLSDKFVIRRHQVNEFKRNMINLFDWNGKILSKKIETPFFVKYISLKNSLAIFLLIQFSVNCIQNELDQIAIDLVIFLITISLMYFFSQNSVLRVLISTYFFLTSVSKFNEIYYSKLILDFFFNLAINSSIQIQLGTSAIIILGNLILNYNNIFLFHMISLSQTFVIYFYLNIFYILIFLQRKYIRNKIQKEFRKYELILETYQDLSHFLLIIDENSNILSAN